VRARARERERLAELVIYTFAVVLSGERARDAHSRPIASFRLPPSRLSSSPRRDKASFLNNPAFPHAGRERTIREESPSRGALGDAAASIIEKSRQSRRYRYFHRDGLSIRRRGGVDDGGESRRCVFRSERVPLCFNDARTLGMPFFASRSDSTCLVQLIPRHAPAKGQLRPREATASVPHSDGIETRDEKLLIFPPALLSDRRRSALIMERCHLLSGINANVGITEFAA